MPIEKWIRWACALAAVSVAAWAQPPGPMVCTTNASVPPLVRTEGVTELAGDLVIQCTGGTPTPAGNPVPPVNLRIQYNADVTGRRLAASGFSDALLIADEAGSPANPNRLLCGTPFTGVCAITGTGTGAGVYNGSPNRPNVFQGQEAGLDTIQWMGVPIDPPGSNGVRIFRTANIRLNANQKGPVTPIPQQLTATVSTIGPNSLNLSNPTQTIAFIGNGMDFTAGAAPTFKQCAPENAALYQNANNNGTPQVHLTFKEGFASAYKPRTAAAFISNNTSPNPLPQHVPGAIWNSETGYYDPAFPNVAGRGNAGTAGLADQGTRLLAKFTNVPPSVKLFAPAVITSGQLVARMIVAPASGAGAFVAKNANSFGIANIPVNGAGDATVVYEVLRTDPLQIETVQVPVYVAYNTPQPTPATVLVSGAFGPQTTALQSDATSPLPRFVDTSTPVVAFQIGACVQGGINGVVTAGASTPATTAGVRVNLACDAAAASQSLAVNWQGNQFLLDTVSAATCSNDPAISPAPPASVYDTLVGGGAGRLNGVAGATATWKFQDAGEPGGGKDPIQVVVKNSSGVTVLTINTIISNGNLQAHN